MKVSDFREAAECQNFKSITSQPILLAGHLCSSVVEQKQPKVHVLTVIHKDPVVFKMFDFGIAINT